MGLMDVLGRYAQQSHQPPPDVLDDFDRVAQEAEPDALSEGLEDAFNAEVTPPFEQMVGQLYGRSDSHQRAGLLREILGSRFSPDEAQHMPVNEVEAAAADAARQNPSIIQRVSRFYAEHPQLVQTLGQVALSVAMSGMARRRRM
ncbi:MAG TPA: hypothetical protein VM073_03330 [Usitatibacter sp.]|nr:hypothetical protein [Usitatibacter sp.]